MTLDRITQTDESGKVGLTGQPGQLRQDRTEWTMPGHDNNEQTLGQVSCEQEQDSWNRNQAGQDKGDKADRTGQIGQGNRDGKTIRGQSWCGSCDRTTETGQPESVNLDQRARTGESGQNRKDKSGHDSNTRTAASVELGRKSQGRIARTGQREKTVRTVHP